MTVYELAELKIKEACQRENPDWDGKSFDYGCSIYQSALKAFKSVCDDEHSGASYGFTKQVLKRLLDELPLKAITDEDFVVSETQWNDDETLYSCKYSFSIFKRVNKKTGKVEYNDVHRVSCKDVKNSGHWNVGAITRWIDKQYPITMPYYPKVSPRFVVEFEELDDDKIFVLSVKDYENCTTEIVDEVIE